MLEPKAESTPRAELSGPDDVNKRREWGETQKSSFRPGRILLLGLPPLVDVIGAGKLGSWCGHSLKSRYSSPDLCHVLFKTVLVQIAKGMGEEGLTYSKYGP